MKFKKSFIMAAIMLAILSPLFALCQNVVSSSGGHLENGIVEANWTVGETVTDTYSNSSHAATSGLNQPVLKIVTSATAGNKELLLEVYPNPAVNTLNLKNRESHTLKVNITNITGKVVYSENLPEGGTEVDFSSLTSGTYLVEISDEKGNSKSYQIIKQ